MSARDNTDGTRLLSRLDSIRMNDFERQRVRKIVQHVESFVCVLLGAGSARGLQREGSGRIPRLPTRARSKDLDRALLDEQTISARGTRSL